MDSLFPTVVSSLAIVIVALSSIKSGIFSNAKETINILKETLAAKEIEALRMKGEHDSEMAILRAELKTLSDQVAHLRDANLVLQNTVTGKETLDKIVEIMKPIPALFKPGGFIEQVQLNQQKTLKDLSEILTAMNLSQK